VVQMDYTAQVYLTHARQGKWCLHSAPSFGPGVEFSHIDGLLSARGGEPTLGNAAQAVCAIYDLAINRPVDRGEG
jgi:hypothetical protein